MGSSCTKGAPTPSSSTKGAPTQVIAVAKVVSNGFGPQAPGDPGWMEYDWLPAKFTMGTTLHEKGFSATKQIDMYLFWFHKRKK